MEPIIVIATTLIGFIAGRIVTENSTLTKAKKSVVEKLGHIPSDKTETVIVYVDFDKEGKVKKISFDGPTSSVPKFHQNPWAPPTPYLKSLF